VIEQADMRIALPGHVDEAALRACDPGLPVVALSGPTMGTGWQVRAVVPRGLAPGAIGQAVRARLDTLVAQMSHWEADSVLCQFNRAPADTWVALPPDFAKVMGEALAIAHESEGAFSPAIGLLVDLWGFGPPGPVAAAPDAARIARAMAPGDWRRLAFEPATGRLRQPGGLALDLSAIAKGYAVDAVLDTLGALGIVHALVEVGGELSGRGLRPDGQPWWVDLESPPGAGVPGLRVALHGLSVATSGSYVRGPHNLDPRSGHPAAGGVVSCSVVHPSAMVADGWASALSVMGAQAGLLLATRNSLAARWVVRQGESWHETLSPALLAMLEEG
jgi:FAD:protein FMN transferase